ncbi:cation:dicarboxylate symporter family transporter [Pseudomonas frederiksbergensis]|uniref:Sodium:dicarboxylate symporter n=1 Tax=Pseudomonas frederiksbergensis TaxID=104087 RepID=A0A423HG10_9PSED|nr:cation:dicarboxylase symporter family transporter [Pseudomonas frederiksbergensis]RON12148.1 sodium:dicarboxylate symporter [Pseudomonas frederiksbergensis]
MKRIPLVWQIVAGLLLGVLVGWYFNTHPQYQGWISSEILKPLGDIFIKMMKMVVVPIVFCCMILGIAGGGDNKSFGRMGIKSLGYFFAITGLAIVIGLCFANIFEPGTGTDISGISHSTASVNMEPSKGALVILQNIVPDNVFVAMSEAKLLSVLFFAVLFGLALNSLPREKSAPVVAVVQGISDALIKYFRNELILAFSSAASASVMPQLMSKLEHYGVPRRIVSFVVPVGYAFNLDGASIFLGVATIFVAQLYGIDLSLSQQILLVVTMVLTSKGAAGVPGFAIIILSATLASAGLPLEGVALIAGIFRIIDSGTTTLNVLGNAIAPLVIAKWEKVSIEPSGVARVVQKT